MNCDSSSSDSELSENEEVDAHVLQAFKTMKQSLGAHGLSKSSSISSGRGSNKTVTAKHRLIYQTFSDNKTRNRKLNNNKETVPSTSADTSLPDFVIDKGPANKSSSFSCSTKLSDKDLDDTVEFDLTNIADVFSNDKEENKQYDGEDKNTESSDEDETDDASTQHPVKNKRKSKKNKNRSINLSSRLNPSLKEGDIYINVNPLRNPKSEKNLSKHVQKHTEPEIMKKSVITDDFEKQDSIPSTHASVRKQKRERKLERDKTKGKKWYGMPATELTEERKYDLSVIQMRNVLDPKRFYKSNDLKTAPKYFQFGKVVEDASDFYSSRVPKKQRKSTIVEELLADSKFRQYNKRKYEEVQEAKRLGKGPYKHMKRLKKRKK